MLLYQVQGSQETEIEQFTKRVLPHQVQLVVAAGVCALLDVLAAAIREAGGSRSHGSAGSVRRGQAVLFAFSRAGRLHAQYEVKAQIAHMT